MAALAAATGPPAAPERAAATPLISVAGIAVGFDHGGERQPVLSRVDLAIERGAFVSLIGASGCGKSTLLKILAGLAEPDEGSVLIAGLAPKIAAERRLIGLVFQDANLLPWKTALDNAAFLLEIADRSCTRRQARDRAFEILRMVGLEAAVDKRPSQLSGGMRQRVALARALALDPEVLLLDEPFGALDAITREEMSYILLDVWERTGKTVVLVTHSIDEAVLLSHRVHVMGLRPARIVESLTIPLPYPRGEASFADPRFNAIEAQLRGLLLESHGRKPRQ